MGLDAALGAPANALVVRARAARLAGVGLDHADVRAVAVGRLHDLKLDEVDAGVGQHLRPGLTGSKLVVITTYHHS